MQANPVSAVKPPPVNANTYAFKFVEQLAKEVSSGRIELPAFPDVAVRVRKVLADENVSVEKIARVVSSEGGLAARVLALANSAALNRGGKHIVDMKMAINRIGHNNVRTAAVSFAIMQLRRAAELKDLVKDLEELWHEATTVAALAYAVARRTRINADEAMLTGLLHNVGKIYILSRAQKHPALFADREALNAIQKKWFANVGKAIVENWGFSSRISDAIGDHEDLERQVEEGDLTDILTVATLMAGFIGKTQDLELHLPEVAAFKRLNLDSHKCYEIMEDGAEEIQALRAALGE